MPKKTKEVTVPMSEELDDLIIEQLGYGDSKSAAIREYIREGLRKDGVDPARIPAEDDQRFKQETDGGQATLAD